MTTENGDRSQNCAAGGVCFRTNQIAVATMAPLMNTQKPVPMALQNK